MLPSLAAATAAAACVLVFVDLPMETSAGGSELVGGRGEGSETRGRTLDKAADEVDVPGEVDAGVVADCLVEFAFALAVAAPSFSLADKVRLAEFVCSSEGITCWGF